MSETDGLDQDEKNVTLYAQLADERLLAPQEIKDKISREAALEVQSQDWDIWGGLRTEKIIEMIPKRVPK